MAQIRVFVSHSHKDEDFTRRLVDDLYQAGAEVWVDVTGLNHGNFMQRIDEALARCEWMVLVLTPHAIASNYVKDEVYAALLRVQQGYMRAVVPILATTCTPGTIPPQWDALHRYDATNNYGAALAGVVSALGLTANVRLSTPPVPTAASTGELADAPLASSALAPSISGPAKAPPSVPTRPWPRRLRLYAITLLVLASFIGLSLLGLNRYFTSQVKPPVNTPVKTPLSVNKALILATDFPISGIDAPAMLPAEYAVNLAVSQNRDLGNGYTLTVINKDDEGTSGADPIVGAANIEDLVTNKQVMGIVGPFNDGVAKKEIPIVNAAGGPVLMSPTNTNPGLTIQQYAAANFIDYSTLHPVGKPDYYFRIPGNDVAQGRVDATVALSAQVNCKKAFIVDDNTPYGKGLGDFFTQIFTAGGGSTVGTRTSITSNTSATLSSLATTIKASGADCVFYGGVTTLGGPVLKKDLVAIGYTGPMVGGDGIASDPGFITIAGAAAAGTVGTVAGTDVSTLTSGAAATFKTDYTAFVANLPNKALLSYSARAYDAAMIEITAIKNLITANKTVTRAAVRDQVQNIQYTGITGNISFDANGDNAGTNPFAVYAVDPTINPNAWTYKRQVNSFNG